MDKIYEFLTKAIKDFEMMKKMGTITDEQYNNNIAKLLHTYFTARKIMEKSQIIVNVA
jgi:hypothetical protein